MEKLNKIIESYPPELRLLLVCCGCERWKTEDIKKNINWETFSELVKRHRIYPHVYKFLTDNPGIFPDHVQTQIRKHHNANSIRMLGLSSEMLRLLQLFSSQEIEAIPLKGPALAYQLYNDPGMRHSADLDFLVLQEDLDKIYAIMLKEGYKQIKPDFQLSLRQKKVHITLIHHYYFKHPNTGLLIEIHWKLVTPPSLFLHSEKLFFDSLQPCEPFPWIKPELLIHYLIVHGSMHRWYKLFWLKDIDKIFRQNLIKDTEYFNKLTLFFRDERMVNLSLTLAELLFNTPVPLSLKPKKFSMKLLSVALRAIRTPEEKLHERTLERAGRLMYVIRLKPGINHFITCLKAPGTNYNDWKTLPLPDSLFFMYYPLRPFLWFWSVFIKNERTL